MKIYLAGNRLISDFYYMATVKNRLITYFYKKDATDYIEFKQNFLQIIRSEQK